MADVHLSLWVHGCLSVCPACARAHRRWDGTHNAFVGDIAVLWRANFVGESKMGQPLTAGKKEYCATVTVAG